MDLDPTAGRPGTLGPGRHASALATEARRAVAPSALERETTARASAERAGYASPGLRPGGDATRDVVLHLSQRALALAKSAADKPPQTKSVDEEPDTPGPSRQARRHGADAPGRKVDVRA
jgi:hypothetical protein